MTAVFISLLISFLIALLGTFFKCVQEDATGKRLYSRRGLPMLTKEGRCILVLLFASFFSSFWVSWKAAAEEQKSQEIEQKNMIAGLTKVDSVRMHWEFVRRGTQINWKSLNHEPRDDDVLTAFFCPEHARGGKFTLLLKQDFAFLVNVFRANGAGKCTIEKVFDWGPNVFRIEGTDIEEWLDGGGFNITVDKQELEKLNPAPDSPPVVASLVPDGDIIAFFAPTAGENLKDLSQILRTTLPQKIKLGIMPNMAFPNSSSWVFTKSEPIVDENLGAVAVRFKLKPA